MTLKTEFEVFDKVYYLKEDDIVEGSVRSVKFPPYDRHATHPKSENIQYGLLTKKKLEFYENGAIYEGGANYDWRFASQMGKTPKELLDKMMKLYT